MLEAKIKVIDSPCDGAMKSCKSKFNAKNIFHAHNEHTPSLLN